MTNNYVFLLGMKLTTMDIISTTKKIGCQRSSDTSVSELLTMMNSGGVKDWRREVMMDILGQMKPWEISHEDLCNMIEREWLAGDDDVTKKIRHLLWKTIHVWELFEIWRSGKISPKIFLAICEAIALEEVILWPQEGMVDNVEMPPIQEDWQVSDHYLTELSTKKILLKREKVETIGAAVLHPGDAIEIQFIRKNKNDEEKDTILDVTIYVGYVLTARVSGFIHIEWSQYNGKTIFQKTSLDLPISSYGGRRAINILDDETKSRLPEEFRGIFYDRFVEQIVLFKDPVRWNPGLRGLLQSVRDGFRGILWTR